MIEAPWKHKHVRAGKLLNEFDKLAANYIESTPFLSDLESWDGKELVISVNIEGIPKDELSTLVGDILHNQRSALDAAYFALIQKEASADLEGFNEIADKLYFPVVDSRAQLEKYPGIKQYGSSKTVDALEQFQPYRQSGDLDDEYGARLQSHYYKQLYAYSNFDKHKGVNVINMLVNDITLFHSGDIEFLGGQRLISDNPRILRYRFLFDRAVLAHPPQFSPMVILGLEPPPGRKWISEYAANSLLHIIQSQNEWALDVITYLLAN
jgi:hypothetical protein